MRYRLRLSRYSLRASMWLAMVVGKRITAFEAVSIVPTRRFCRLVFHPHNSVTLARLRLARPRWRPYKVTGGRKPCTAAVLAEVKGVQALPLGRAQ